MPTSSERASNLLAGQPVLVGLDLTAHWEIKHSLTHALVSPRRDNVTGIVRRVDGELCYVEHDDDHLLACYLRSELMANGEAVAPSDERLPYHTLKYLLALTVDVAIVRQMLESIEISDKRKQLVMEIVNTNKDLTLRTYVLLSSEADSMDGGDESWDLLCDWRDFLGKTWSRWTAAHEFEATDGERMDFFRLFHRVHQVLAEEQVIFVDAAFEQAGIVNDGSDITDDQLLIATQFIESEAARVTAQQIAAPTAAS